MAEYDPNNPWAAMYGGVAGSTGPTGVGYPYYTAGQTGPTGYVNATPYELGATGPTGYSTPQAPTGSTSSFIGPQNPYDQVSSIYVTPKSIDLLSKQQQTQQPIQPTQQGGSPPYAPTFNGQTVNYGGGRWRSVNGQWVFDASNEQMAAQQQSDQEAINQIYAPAFAALNEQQRALEAQQPGEEQTIQGQYTRGIEGITGQEAEAQIQLGKRTTTSEQAKANALAQARQLYGELSQRNAAMFGGRSSAGPFAQELLGRETQRRFGEIGTTSEQDRQAITDETIRLVRWVDTQKNEWGRKKDEALQTLKNQFTQMIGQINSQRGMLETEKARERNAALVDARNRQDAINAADWDFQQRLALFQAQKQGEFSTVNPYSVSDTGMATQTMGAFNPSTIGQIGGQAASASFAPGVYKNEKGQLIDQYGRLLQA